MSNFDPAAYNTACRRAATDQGLDPLTAVATENSAKLAAVDVEYSVEQTGGFTMVATFIGRSDVVTCTHEGDWLVISQPLDMYVSGEYDDERIVDLSATATTPQQIVELVIERASRPAVGDRVETIVAPPHPASFDGIVLAIGETNGRVLVRQTDGDDEGFERAYTPQSLRIVERATYAVSHNGTQDWSVAPHGTSRDDDGVVIFPSLSAALTFATSIADDARRFARESGSDVAEMMRDVPVYVLAYGTGRVVVTIDA